MDGVERGIFDLLACRSSIPGLDLLFFFSLEKALRAVVFYFYGKFL